MITTNARRVEKDKMYTLYAQTRRIQMHARRLQHIVKGCGDLGWSRAEETEHPNTPSLTP